MTLQQDYTLAEVAQALRKSTRWLRQRVKEGAEHQQPIPNGTITFTAEQVEKLRASMTRVPVEQSITTGRKRKSA